MAAIQLDIGEQYRIALRTKSYQDMFAQVQDKLGAMKHEMADESNKNNSVQPKDAARSSAGQDFPVPEFNVEEHLIQDFLEGGEKASELCYHLLDSIAGARRNNGAARRIVDRRSTGARLWDIAQIGGLDNPLSEPSLARCIRLHGDGYAAMVPRLVSVQKRFGMTTRRRRSLDEAARGAFGIRCEFDTVGRQLARLNDEIEHEHRVSRIMLRGGRLFSPLKEEIERELHEGEGRMLEQLQELEERVHLCLLTISRARNLLTQGILPSCT